MDLSAFNVFLNAGLQMFPKNFESNSAIQTIILIISYLFIWPGWNSLPYLAMYLNIHTALAFIKEHSSKTEKKGLIPNLIY